MKPLFTYQPGYLTFKATVGFVVLVSMNHRKRRSKRLVSYFGISRNTIAANSSPTHLYGFRIKSIRDSITI